MTDQVPSERGYLDLLNHILNHGEERHGRNGLTLSTFGERLVFDLKQGFPLLTTKRVFWRGIVEELLWFLRGSTDATELQEKGVHIWDGNTTREFLDNVGLHAVPEGQIGAGYGFQWRAFGGDYPLRRGGVDQIRYILSELKTNPHGRRAVLVAWNPKQLQMAALPPCHFAYQFYIGKNGLSCQMQMRSCDVCAGLPFNIASTSLLTHLLAHLLGLEADRVCIVMGDTHVYEEHFQNAREQLARSPLTPPTLRILRPAPHDATVDDMVMWLETLTSADVEIHGYNHHPPLKYAMVA